jgi:hypothetical protein
MNKKIDNPADCEVQSVIRFLNAQNVRAIDIHRQLTAVYGEGVMNESSVKKWCRMFNEGRTNVQDEERSGRPSLINEDLKKQTVGKFDRIDARLLTNCIKNSLKSLDPFFMKLSVSISGTKINLCKVSATDADRRLQKEKTHGRWTEFFGALSPRRRQVSGPYCHRG